MNKHKFADDFPYGDTDRPLLPYRIIPRNETPAAKHYRLAVAMYRAFIKECPDDAVKIMRELLPEVVK